MVRLFDRHRFSVCASRGAVIGAVLAFCLTGASRAQSAQDQDSAEGRAAQADDVVRAGSADRPVVIREHAGWDRNCEAVAHPALYLAEPPRHGSVCMHVADIRIRALTAGTEGQCIGQTVRGVQLLYRTEAGYAGADTLRYAVQYPSIRRMVAVTIAVSPDVRAAQAQPLSIAEPSPAQQAGPVPPCAELMF